MGKRAIIYRGYIRSYLAVLWDLFGALHLSFYIDLLKRFVFGLFENLHRFCRLKSNGTCYTLISSLLLDEIGSTIVAKELDALGIAFKSKFFGQKSNINVRTVT